MLKVVVYTYNIVKQGKYLKVVFYFCKSGFSIAIENNKQFVIIIIIFIIITQDFVEYFVLDFGKVLFWWWQKMVDQANYCIIWCACQQRKDVGYSRFWWICNILHEERST